MFLFSASLCRSFLYSHIICKSKYSTFHVIVKCHVPWGNRMVVSFTTTNYFVNPSLWWPIYVFNSVVNTKLLTNYLAGEDLPLWCFHTAGSVVHIIIANERICKLFIYLKASVADLKLAYLYVEKIIHQQGINNNTLTFPPPPSPSPPPLLALMISVWKMLPLLRCSKRVDTAWKSLGYVQFLLFLKSIGQVKKVSVSPLP